MKKLGDILQSGAATFIIGFAAICLFIRYVPGGIVWLLEVFLTTLGGITRG